jgi:hypothetical protein
MIKPDELRKLARGPNKHSNSKLFNFLRRDGRELSEMKQAKRNLKEAALKYLKLQQEFNKKKRPLPF